MTEEKSHTILCADDDPDIQRIYRQFLQKRGYIVKTVSNGALVLSELKKSPVDLIIMDAKMPVMNGIEATVKIRSHPDFFHIPILFVSGYTNEEEIYQCLQMGGTDFICKPFEPNEMLAKIRFTIRKYHEAIECPYEGLPPGARLGGRYEVIRRIDRGGFSNIYLARDITSVGKNKVALKVFNFPYTKRTNRQNLYSIIRETYQLCKLDHPNIVKIYDFGQHGSVIYIVMEFIHGQPLDLLVGQNGPLAEANCAFVGIHVASILEYLEKRDMVHRDIKPDNIMITRDGDIKLVDFGLAKQCKEQTLSLKRDEFRGTAQYVSPEYINGQETTIASDIYSLGATLFFTLTGRPPFTATDTRQILYQQLHADPADPRTLVSGIDDAFAEHILWMLAKDPKARPSLGDIITFFSTYLEESNEIAGSGT
ncbi:MAG: response regulator [Lentisphaerae bacterium]|nr:MAG: response regulator [Lentisphaerota bacterium]